MLGGVEPWWTAGNRPAFEVDDDPRERLSRTQRRVTHRSMNGSLDPDGETGFLEHFADERLLEAIAHLDAAAREVPATGMQVQVVTAPEQKELVTSEKESLDADSGPLVARHPWR